MEVSGLDYTSTSKIDENNGDSAIQTGNTENALMVSESGSSAKFTVVLSVQPSYDVTLTLESSDEGEVIVDASALTFTASNWNEEQSVTVTGVDDSVEDGSVAASILLTSSSKDNQYDNLDSISVSVINVDNDSAGITVNASTTILTSESGSSTGFDLVLNTRPADSVVVHLSSSDPLEGDVSPSNITFTSASWDIPVTITVTGADDPYDDGDKPYTIDITSTSNDSAYSMADPISVNVLNLDNDTADIIIAPYNGLVVYEAGATFDAFYVRLASRPTASVYMDISTMDPAQLTIISPFAASTGTLTFTTDDWDIPQPVIIQAIDDGNPDGIQTISINTSSSISADDNYNGINPTNVAIHVVDDETAAGSNSVVPLNTTNLQTTEYGSLVTIQLVLSSKPTADVTVGTITSLDPSEGALISPFGPAELTFTTSDWNQPSLHEIIVQGQSDDGDSTDQPYTIDLGTTSSFDINWNGLDAGQVDLVNQDSPNVIRIFLTTTPVPIGAGEFNSIATADTLCNNDPKAGGMIFKAMLVDGVNRVACTTTDCGIGGLTENVDWVFQPNINYYSEDGSTLLGTTNNYGIFVDNLVSPITPETYYWTGLNPDWTIDPINCTGWSTTTGDGHTGWSKFKKAQWYSDTTQACSDLSIHLLCVQQ